MGCFGIFKSSSNNFCLIYIIFIVTICLVHSVKHCAFDGQGSGVGSAYVSTKFALEGLGESIANVSIFSMDLKSVKQSVQGEGCYHKPALCYGQVTNLAI